MYTRTQSGFIFRVLKILLAGLLLPSACSTVKSTTTLPDLTATSAPMATIEPTGTMAPVATEIPILNGALYLSLDTGNLATGYQAEMIPATPASHNAPFWEVLPEYTRVTLEGYPISDHLLAPQIFIYPVKELSKINEGAGQIVTSLQILLQTPQEVTTMPFLPLFNAAQMIHAQIQFLDIINGQGVRYLTWFSQGIMPVNNDELIYTYQGLTSNGQYYVAAVMPVNHPSLPVDGKVTGNEPLEFTSDYSAYLNNVVNTLDSQATNTFTPDLSQLDAMMSSLEIN